VIPREWQPFVDELRAATVANMKNPLVRSWLRPGDAMAWMRKNVRYQFNPKIEVASLSGALSRQGPNGPSVWAACAEAAAVVAAVAQLRTLPWYWCVELSSNYAHVVCYVAGVPYDVYQERARDIRECSFTVRGLHD
jgi:hypothetical protein